MQDTRRESRATDNRVAQLEQGRLSLAEQVADANTRCAGDHCSLCAGLLVQRGKWSLGGRLRTCTCTAGSSHEKGCVAEGTAQNYSIIDSCHVPVSS